jgi:serine/threonine protein kinase
MSSTPFEAPTLEALAGLLPAYEFQAFIAQGGMGAVYKARQRSLDRDVAIKILPRELGEDPEFRKSFETEARAMARLNHPNLIGVYDSGDVDGMLYIAMEYVNGKSLYYSAYNLAVDPAQAVTIVKGICDGLAHAHENGVIHRDIKPANILLTPKREPKIGDFGLARPTGSEGPGLIMGTPGYTAPEVIDHPEHADRRSDIYAVGVILYELLTGRRQEPNCPLPSAVGGCDRALDTIWQNATHPNPAFRYSDAGLMSKALDEWMTKGAANAPRKLVSAAPKVAPKRAALAVPAAKASPAANPAGGTPSASPETPVAPVPQVVVGTGNWSLVRNLVIIAVLLLTIAFTYKIYKRTLADREDANRLAIEQEAERKAKAQADARFVAANPAPTPPAVKPVPSTPVVPEPPKKESSLEALDRLKRSLASGKRDEMPPGTIRHGESDFLLIPTPMTWQQASSFADAHGGHLPLPAAEEDLTWLSSLVPDKPAEGNNDAALWVGAGRSGRSAWTSVDGSTWKLKPPAGTGLYLAVDDLGLIRVRKAEDRYPFFIQWQRDGSNPAELGSVLKKARESLGLPVPLFPPGTIAYEARHILIVQRDVTAAEATAFAEMAGGNLMVPASRDEAGWLAEQLAPLSSTKGLWLGGSRDGAEWKWATGEGWSFANWEDGYPTESGNGLVILPGKGWRDADPAEPASGFIIEWSNDRETASAAPAPPRKALPGDLAAKSKALLAALDQERQRDLATNAKNFNSNLDTWLRRQNRTDSTRWGPEVASVKELVVKNRVPSKIGPDTGIKLSEDMAKFCSDSLAKQQTIDTTFNLKATKIRDAYLVRLKEAHDDAKTRGQAEIAESIAGELQSALNMAGWLEDMGLESSADADPLAPDAKAGGFKTSGSSFVGKWKLAGPFPMAWEALADGSIEGEGRGRGQGTWEEDGGKVVIKWEDGRTLNLRKRGSSFVGEDERGNAIELEPAD